MGFKKHLWGGERSPTIKGGRGEKLPKFVFAGGEKSAIRQGVGFSTQGIKGKRLKRTEREYMARTKVHHEEH